MSYFQPTERHPILDEIAAERARQVAKWGEQNHPDGTGGHGRLRDADAARRECQRQFAEGTGTWLDILDEEVAEAYAEEDPAALRAELIQVAAVAVAWIEAIDRRPATPPVAAPGEGEATVASQQSLFPTPPVSPLILSRHFAVIGREKGAYSRYQPVKRVACDECVWTLHEAHGKGEPPRAARIKRVSASGDVRLCSGHADLWKKRDGGSRG